jgi:hypothetical protein
MRTYPTMPRSTYLWLVTAALLAVVGIDQLPAWQGWANVATAAIVVGLVVHERRRWARATRLWKAKDKAKDDVSELA